MSRAAQLMAVRGKLAALENRKGDVLPFGDRRIDACLPGGGLPLGCWHEAIGEGLESETAAATGAFIAALAAPLASRGAVVWVMRRQDLHAPGLASLGFPAERLIQVGAPSQTEALIALEDALRTPGIAAAIGEVERLDLIAGRRLQLACERHGAAGFVIRRRLYGRRRSDGLAAAATTRWRIASAPSEPEPGEPGLGPPRWRVELERCRGGRPGAWIMEKADGPLCLRVVAELGDRGLDTPSPIRLAG
ncbi:MAG TPA: protein imuA [Caulobacteraceae bacterium]|jgi:protein ImuA|nr:protein imuA [Caulobacteraceae bacterium]